MNRKTLKSCQNCGKPFYGGNDCFYCPACAREKKLDTVVRIRTCQDCGAEFYGGPRAKRCPTCADSAIKAYRKVRGNSAPARTLGSIDKCKMCGKEYAVKSGRQMYCPDCARSALLSWQRDHKKGYDKASGQDVKKQKRRSSKVKICVYCLKPFKTSSNTNFCSDACRMAQKRLQTCEYDIKRGQKRNLQKYLDDRESIRNIVSKMTQ